MRLTQNEKPLMVNAERILKIVTVGDLDQRGTHLYTSDTDYFEVDQGMQEMMNMLGFDRRE
ncbi:MAG: hypothetical protein ACREQI_06445 [Candidatus Binataceae bacterium]